jgi:nicotinate-nucleotide--dimethylbenzimidazole phosphoribosyltransferase
MTGVEERVVRLCERVERPGEEFASSARAHLDRLTKPPGSLGRLEEIAVSVAVVQQTTRPDVRTKAVIVFAGDHGVVSRGVSPYPQAVTAQMVANFASGGAAVNQLAEWCGARVVVVDVGVAVDVGGAAGVLDQNVRRGTADMTTGAAVSREEAAEAFLVGAETAGSLATQGVRLLGVGEMGIGNSTAAAAVTAALLGIDPADVTGPGTGLGAEGVARKVAVVREAIAVNRPERSEPLDVLSKVGGLELAAVAGSVVGAASAATCVCVDGFIAGAAALAALRMCPAARGYVLPSHLSAEPGHASVLDALGVRPVLDLGMRLGEASGAALAMGVIDAACRTMSGMATFDEAGVDDGG